MMATPNPAAPATPPPSTPEHEGQAPPAEPQHGSSPPQPQSAAPRQQQQPSAGADSADQQAGNTTEEMDVDIDTVHDADPITPASLQSSANAQTSGQVGPSISGDPGQAAAAADASERHKAEEEEAQLTGRQGAAKPTVIRRGAVLPNRSKIKRLDDFADDCSVKAALADAWSQTSDIGNQLAALYELFGDAILPYVPMLPGLTYPM